MALPFTAPSRGGDAWFSVGLTSSFPDITDSGSSSLYEPHSCYQGDSAPGCKVFRVPHADSSQTEEVEGDDMISHDGAALQDQVLVFQYKGKFHAVDNGIPFDIEDFGIALSAGLTCPKHGWSFDLFSGRADRGNYMLKRWEVQLRPVENLKAAAGDGGNCRKDEENKEVWVRRRQRMG